MEECLPYLFKVNNIDIIPNHESTFLVPFLLNWDCPVSMWSRTKTETKNSKKKYY